MKPKAPRVALVFLALSAPALGFAGCLFGSGDDCFLNLACTGSSTGTGTGTGGAGAGGTSSSATGGKAGGGTGGGCDVAACPDVPPGPCSFRGSKACQGGACAVVYTVGNALSDEYGSCTRTMCGADGGLYEEPDDTDVYDDGNPCTIRGCADGGLTQEPAAVNQPCNGDAGYCEVDPFTTRTACAACIPNTTIGCPQGATCAAGTCVPGACTNKVKDPTESDKDCGGVNSGCLPCADGLLCSVDTDCLSGICAKSGGAQGACAKGTCTDHKKNQDEADVDCGGTTAQCAKCIDGQRCVQPGDCASGVCKGNACIAPSCTDGVKNGDEAGRDCGGSACAPCGP